MSIVADEDDSVPDLACVQVSGSLPSSVSVSAEKCTTERYPWPAIRQSWSVHHTTSAWFSPASVSCPAIEPVPSLNDEWTCIAMLIGWGTSWAQAARSSASHPHVPSALAAPRPAAPRMNERLEIRSTIFAPRVGRNR